MTDVGVTSEATTEGVCVRVLARYLPERSDPDRAAFFFVYTVRITNFGRATVQLRRRRWHIADATGATELVEGGGVVGAEPVLPPGASFEYTSFCPLRTPTGRMRGAYTMERADGTTFEAEIAPFLLSFEQAFH